MQAVNNVNSRQKLENSCVYTHQLPFGVRRDICNLLDADQSWRTLGGQFMHLDATHLKLIGQALFRNDSPTEELLNKLDSANMRISELVYYLAQMGHCRALEILKPFVIDPVAASNGGASSGQQSSNNGASLNTPTPSFSSIQPMAITNPSELDLISPSDYQNQNPDEWSFLEASRQPIENGRDQHQHHYHYHHHPHPHPHHQQQQQAVGATDDKPPTKCHNAAATQSAQAKDPGEEIVRLACANNGKRTSISDQEVVNQLRLIMQITYNELKQASNDFADSNILGNGGFASVYRGYWKGTDVAIKRLRCNLMDQALNELTILNSYRIDNILPIYGISIDGPEACLVYQFMANGSLEDCLSCKGNTPPLSWDQRATIAEGVAKGLYYLHTLRNKPLVHGDAKSANVLLDSQFVPKLGDFGLARQVFKGKNPQTDLATHCTVSSIHGTSVYLPPEYLRHKILSPAVDAYSYGIVLLEMATGRRAYDGKRLLIDYVEDEMKLTSGGQVNYNQLKDFRLQEDTDGELRACFELLLRLGLNCAHRVKKKRPDMGQVLNHFAQFKLNASTSPNIDTNLLTSGLSSTPQSNATTRTLTPELSTDPMNAGFRPSFRLNNHHDAAGPAQQNGAAGAYKQDSSLLMSVDEEQELTQGAQVVDRCQNAACPQRQAALPRAQYDNRQQQQPEVEAMIPLLTELGFNTEQETN